MMLRIISDTYISTILYYICVSYYFESQRFDNPTSIEMESFFLLDSFDVVRLREVVCMKNTRWVT